MKAVSPKVTSEDMDFDIVLASAHFLQTSQWYMADTEKQEYFLCGV